MHIKTINTDFDSLDFFIIFLINFETNRYRIYFIVSKLLRGINGYLL